MLRSRMRCREEISIVKVREAGVKSASRSRVCVLALGRERACDAFIHQNPWLVQVDFGQMGAPPFRKPLTRLQF
jgi:hypothetical protein